MTDVTQSMSCTEKSKVVIPARVGMTVLFIFCVTSIIKIHLQIKGDLKLSKKQLFQNKLSSYPKRINNEEDYDGKSNNVRIGL